MVWLKSRVSGLRDGGGSIHSVLAVSLDISDRAPSGSSTSDGGVGRDRPARDVR